MRIKSTFKDYYDCIQGYGPYQEEPLYIREKKVISYELYQYPLPTRTFSLGKDSYESVTVGFCGNVYFGFGKRDSTNRFDHVMFSLGEIEKYISGLDNDIINEFYNGPVHKRVYWRQYTFNSLKEFYEKRKLDVGQYKRLFVENHPIFVGLGSQQTITYNEWLAPYKFQKVFDPFQTYQEIQMYLSNLSYPNRPIPAVSDKDMIVAKGFDKYSFRKDKKSK